MLNLLIQGLIFGSIALGANGGNEGNDPLKDCGSSRLFGSDSTTENLVRRITPTKAETLQGAISLLANQINSAETEIKSLKASLEFILSKQEGLKPGFWVRLGISKPSVEIEKWESQKAQLQNRITHAERKKQLLTDAKKISETELIGSALKLKPAGDERPNRSARLYTLADIQKNNLRFSLDFNPQHLPKAGVVILPERSPSPQTAEVFFLIDQMPDAQSPTLTIAFFAPHHIAAAKQLRGFLRMIFPEAPLHGIPADQVIESSGMEWFRYSNSDFSGAFYFSTQDALAKYPELESRQGFMERALGGDKNSGVMILSPGPRFLRLNAAQKLLDILIENGNLQEIKTTSP